MSSAIVRTVTGDIPPAHLGPCDAHEHLFLATPIQPGEEFVELEPIVEEVRSLSEAGARSVVDWTPIGLGRSPEGLRAVAAAAGLNVVAATGLHRDAHYVADDPLRTTAVEDLAERFTRELAEGMDDTDARAGIIKVGASYHRLTGFEERVFEAAAAAHGRVGAPVCVHTEHGTMGGAIVERLTPLGVPAERIILAHVDRNPDAGEHSDTAAAGAWLQCDGPGRTKYWPDSTILELIDDLAARGHAGRLLVGGDVGRRSMLRAYGGGPGLDYVFARFKPRLARELGGELARTIFEENPARAFAFEPMS